MDNDYKESIIHIGCKVRATRGPKLSDRGKYYTVAANCTRGVVVAYPVKKERDTVFHGHDPSYVSDSKLIENILNKFVEINGLHGFWCTPFTSIDSVKCYITKVPNEFLQT